MKVDTIPLPVGQSTPAQAPNPAPTQTQTSTPTNDMPLINADDIKTILYLGIKGDIKLESGPKHAVDTFA